MFSPFVIRSDIVVVEGGGLKDPWVLDVKRECGNRIFAELSMCDRKLARALGLSLYERAPFAGTTLLSYLAKLRNTYVDELIIINKQGLDPMADDETVNRVGLIQIKKREQEFMKANVPKIIELDVPACTTQDGIMLGGTRISVYATSRTDVSVTMEMTAANMEWMSQAIHADWDAHGSPWCQKRKASVIDELPELQHAACKYRQKARGTVIACHYRTNENQWKEHTKCLPKNILQMCDRNLRKQVADIEESVQSFYNKNHNPGDETETVGANDLQEYDAGGDERAFAEPTSDEW